MSAPSAATWVSGRAALIALLPILLCFAAACDVKWRRIPNLLTGTVALFGVLAGLTGIGSTLTGGLAAAAAALLIGLLLQLLRVMGGGDVKLFAATAMWLGPSATGEAALATAVAGGILGLVFLRRGKGRGKGRVTDAELGGPDVIAPRLAARLQLDDGPDADRVPYGVAIAAGSMWVWWGLIASRGGLT